MQRKGVTDFTVSVSMIEVQNEVRALQCCAIGNKAVGLEGNAHFSMAGGGRRPCSGARGQAEGY